MPEIETQTELTDGIDNKFRHTTIRFHGKKLEIRPQIGCEVVIIRAPDDSCVAGYETCLEFPDEREKKDLWQVKQLLEQNEKNIERTEEQSKHAQKQVVQLVEAAKSLQQQIDNGQIDDDKCSETSTSIGFDSGVYETCLEYVQNHQCSETSTSIGFDSGVYETCLEYVGAQNQYSDLLQAEQGQILQRVDAFKENNEDIWSNFFPSAVAHLPIKYPLTNNIVCHLDGSATRAFLAEGAFGAVFMGRLSETGETVVVKEYINGKSSPNAILREAIALQRLYPTGFVPKCFGVTKTAAGVAIVQEFFGGGTTLHSLLYESGHSLNQSMWVGMCFQLTFALQRVHEDGFLLNDIKADNVLVDCSRPGGNLNIRFIDMGHAAKVPIEFHVSPEKRQQPSHYAPEVLCGCPTSISSDIYSLGCIFQCIDQEVGIPQLGLLAQSCLSPNRDERPPIHYVIGVLEEILMII
ncbi:hypothetical protein ScPMuIL_013214 [Solemya velum]